MQTETRRRGAAAGTGPVGVNAAITGILSGATVLTLDGELPVEHLAPGDRVITRDSGMAVLREIRRSDRELAPVTVRAGSLGHSRPDRAPRLAPGTLVHVRDWRAQAMFGAAAADVPARRLIDGEFVGRAPVERTTVHDLVFDRPHIIYVDGLELSAGSME